MRGLLFVAALATPVTAGAHPHQYIDQQVQLTVGLETVELTVVIVPSIQDAAAMFAHIDGDGDGAVSLTELQSFGAEVLAGAELTVDDRTLVFTQAVVAVPDAAEVATGTAAITVTASTDVRLAERGAHRVDFVMSYGVFSHNWFVQPFFFPDLLKNTRSPSVDRTADDGTVVIRFSTS